MSKVMLAVSINNGEISEFFNTKGILNEKQNILIYDDNNGVKTILKMKENKLIRETAEYNFEIGFCEGKKTSAVFFLKQYKKYVSVDVFTNKILNYDNKYFIEYIVDSVDKFKYSIEWFK